MLLSIIIVNFQSQDFLTKCLESLEKQLKNLSFEVILVNNDPTPLKKDFFAPFSFPHTLLETNENLGFGAGCNLANQKALGEFLFFLNPDSFLTDDSLKKALDFLQEKPSVGVVGGKIFLFPEKIIQPWTSGKKTSLWRILFRHNFGASWKSQKPVSVDWVSGTALLTRKKLFEEIGGFDKDFFMYFEDQDLCLRIKNSGFKIFFLPFFSVNHYNGKSWDDNQQKKRIFYHSQDIFFQKHHPRWEKTLLKFFRFILKGR